MAPAHFLFPRSQSRGTQPGPSFTQIQPLPGLGAGGLLQPLHGYWWQGAEGRLLTSLTLPCKEVCTATGWEGSHAVPKRMGANTKHSHCRRVEPSSTQTPPVWGQQHKGTPISITIFTSSWRD